MGRAGMARRKPPRVVLPETQPGVTHEKYPVPRVFRPVTDSPPGRFPLLKVFSGLDVTVPFRKYAGDDKRNLEIAEQTAALVSDGPGWMYVAPPKTPPEVLAGGFRMFETRDDVIVVSRSYLANGPRMDVYLDVIHEFMHILQRKQGRDIWPSRKIPYVDRPTEIEAYAYSVAEARRLGVPDSYLRKYLHVPWIRRSEYLRLLRHLGVSAPRGRRPRP
jgi:hypothetical protein